MGKGRKRTRRRKPEEPEQPQGPETLEVFDSIWTSGRIPDGWVPSQSPPKFFGMNNQPLEEALTKALPGTWKKVYHKGFLSHTGKTLYIHYHQHLETGKVFNVKPKYDKK